MKKLIILSAIAMSGLIYNSAQAQIGIHVGFRIGHPVYAPAPVVVQEAPVYQDQATAEYDNDYYFLPDEDAYYSIAEQCYYYNDGGNWISAAYLPGYANFDWRSARRFEIRAPHPYLNNAYYHSRFGGADNHYQAGYNNTVRYNQGNYRAPEQRFDARGGYNNSVRFNQAGYRAPEQHFDNRPMGRESYNPGNNQFFRQNYDHQANNRGGDQFNQNRGGERGNNGGQHFTQNNDRGHSEGGGEGRRGF